MIFAEIIVYSAGIYLLNGVLFALWFVFRGAAKIDDSAKDAGFGFRAIIFFGAAAFWVLFAYRLFICEKRPIEQNPHRQKSLEAK